MDLLYAAPRHPGLDSTTPHRVGPGSTPSCHAGPGPTTPELHDSGRAARRCPSAAYTSRRLALSTSRRLALSTSRRLTLSTSRRLTFTAARGFTLAELLVAVAIIALLGAMLVPALWSARIAAWGAGCVSNLKQIGYGVQLYAQDWDDRFPYGLDFADAAVMDSWRSQPFIPDAYDQVKALSENGRILPTVLSSYVRNRQVWRCPADNGLNFSAIENILGGGDTGTDTVYDRYGMSYAYRTELALLQKPMSELREPSLVNVLMDAAGYWHTRYHRAPRQDGDDKDYPQWGYDVLFADSHVRNVTNGGYFDSWGQELSDRDPFDLHAAVSP